MNVTIVGAKERDTPKDMEQVEELMELAHAYYPSCTFVTMLTHVGIGKAVKDFALAKSEQGEFKYQLVVCEVRVYASNLSKSENKGIYIARNATLFELCDMAYYFGMPDRRGTLEDFITRLDEAKRPYKIFMPGEAIELIKI